MVIVKTEKPQNMAKVAKTSGDVENAKKAKKSKIATATVVLATFKHRACSSSIWCSNATQGFWQGCQGFWQGCQGRHIAITYMRAHARSNWRANQPPLTQRREA